MQGFKLAELGLFFAQLGLEPLFFSGLGFADFFGETANRAIQGKPLRVNRAEPFNQAREACFFEIELEKLAGDRQAKSGQALFGD